LKQFRRRLFRGAVVVLPSFSFAPKVKLWEREPSRLVRAGLAFRGVAG
jgi:hypothetical protein